MDENFQKVNSHLCGTLQGLGQPGSHIWWRLVMAPVPTTTLSNGVNYMTLVARLCVATWEGPEGRKWKQPCLLRKSRNLRNTRGWLMLAAPVLHAHCPFLQNRLWSFSFLIYSITYKTSSGEYLKGSIHVRHLSSLSVDVIHGWVVSIHR